MSAQKPKTDLGHHHDDKVRLGNLAGLDRGRVREHVAYGSSSSRRDKEPTSRGRRSVSQSASGARFLSAPVHALEDELLQRRGADVELILQLELERGDLHTCAHKGGTETRNGTDGGRRGKGIWRERGMSSSRNVRSAVRGIACFRVARAEGKEATEHERGRTVSLGSTSTAYLAFCNVFTDTFISSGSFRCTRQLVFQKVIRSRPTPASPHPLLTLSSPPLSSPHLLLPPAHLP